MDGGRDRGFEASRGPAERIIGPRPARRKCDGRIFRRDGGRIVDAGMAAGTCHKPDDERSLWTVVVIGDLEPREEPAEKRIGPRQAGGKCDGRMSAAMAGASSMRGWPPEPATSRTMKGPYGRWS